MSVDDKETSKPILGIAGVLAVWACILGIGAAIYPDIRHPELIRYFLVVGSMGLFLGLWAAMLHAAKSRRIRSDQEETDQPSVSYASVVSVCVIGLASFGYGLQQAKVPLLTDARFTLAIVMTLPVAATAAIIGLSDPRSRRGKMLGLITLLLTALIGCSLWFRR